MATAGSYATPNNDLESPFLAKHRHLHLPFIWQNNSHLVEHLYRLTTDQDNHTAESLEKLWVLCNPPFDRACLKLREIQESVALESPLSVECFNLVVRSMVAEDADNFQHTKCMGWRHVYQVCEMHSIQADEYWCPEFTSSQFACDVSGAHLLLIPVVHDGDWSLYAFNMCDRKLSILDSSSLPYPELRHREVRRKISGALNQSLATLSHGSQNDICSWECQFPVVPRQQNRNDCGFFVFNFMRLWDGHQLTQSFPEGPRELRKDFLAYMMCFKGNEAALPRLVATCISNLSDETKMARKHRRTWAMYPMDSRLLQAAKHDNVEELRNVLVPPSNANGGVEVVVVPNDVGTVASSGDGNQGGSQANENVGRIRLFFRSVTCGIMERVGARHGEQPPQNAAGGEGEAETTETQQPTENGEARGEGEAETLVAQQSPVDSAVGGREADAWRIELPAQSGAIPRLSSMLLGGVTSAGDGVLHIAARHGNLDLVIDICSRAGIRIQRVQEPPENAAAGAGEGGEEARHPLENGVGGQAEETRETQQTPENAAQDTLPFAEFLRARNHKGETCLHEAIRSECVDMVRLLLEVDAALNDETTTTPLVQILDDNGTSPLYLAAMTSRHIVKALTVPYKYQVSHAGPAGRTALHAATLYNIESCKVLLDWKSSLATKQDESGRTPLHYTGRLFIAGTQVILDHDPLSGYITDSEGSLPIHVAARMGRLDIIKKLLEACPSCDSACDAAGRTFLHVAVQNSRANVVKFVCTDSKLRTILNMRDHNGDTALHKAVQKGNWIIFCLFYRNNKVSLNLVNKQGRAPRDLAIINDPWKLNYNKVHWAWMRNDLLAAGAGPGPRESDDFPFRSCVISELDKEKESKRLSKSAALLATVIALILTVSLQVPFDVAEKLHSGTIGSTYSEKKRAKIFGDFIDTDAAVLVTSTMSIFFFTVAGIPYANLEARSMSLCAGGLWLWTTVLLFISSFEEGLSLVYPRGEGLTTVLVMIPAIALFGSMFAVVMSEPYRLLVHVLARRHRLGFRRWFRSLFRFHPLGSSIPFFNVLYLLLSCVLLGLGVALCSVVPKALKLAHSHKTVI